jgi:hypothetical protein
MNKIKLTKEVINSVCEHIENASPIDVACRISGISRRSYYEYLKRARETKGLGHWKLTPHQKLCRELARRTKIAEHLCHSKLITSVYRAAIEGDCKAAQWILSNRPNYSKYGYGRSQEQQQVEQATTIHIHEEIVQTRAVELHDSSN